MCMRARLYICVYMHMHMYICTYAGVNRCVYAYTVRVYEDLHFLDRSLDHGSSKDGKNSA